jgi:hypothetical protein
MDGLVVRETRGSVRQEGLEKATLISSKISFFILFLVIFHQFVMP